MSWLTLSASFEYINYGSTPILNIFIAGTVLRRQNLTTTDVRCDVRQIITSTVDSRTERVEYL